jgi:subtilisin family serine protease
MSGPLQEKITEQIQDILSKKEIFDYSIRLCEGKRKLILKVNEDTDKCIKISYEKFTDSQILADNAKWLRCLECKISRGIVGCNCVWIITMCQNTSMGDLDFNGCKMKVKEVYTYVLNGFSCYSNHVNVEKFERQNCSKLVGCYKDAVARTNVQVVGSFIPRLGVQNSSRRAGTRSSAFAIPANIYAIVIDTGILASHPDLKSKISTKYSKNYSTADRAAWNDDNGHGTHCAGIIGAQDNTIGMVGNAPNVNLIAIKVLDRSGSGSLSNVIAGINYVAQWKTANPSLKGVVNMSLGSGIYEPMDTAVRDLITKYKIPVVVAAGNENQNAANTSPARVVEAITVGAYNDRNNILENFSNYGTVVDLLAPGVDIRSCWLRNGYRVLSGTSMAAPMVAGAVVDMIANPAYSGYTPAQIREKLVADATPLAPVCYNGVVGSNPRITLTTAAINAGTTDKSVYIGSY